MLTTDKIEQSIRESEPAPPQTESVEAISGNKDSVSEPTSRPVSSAWPPIAWVAVGLVLGVGGAAFVLAPRMSTRGGAAAVPVSPITTLNTAPPPSFLKSRQDELLAAQPGALTAAKPGALPGPSRDAFASPPPPEPTGKPMGAAEAFTFSKTAAAMPVQPPPLKGTIFHGRLPLPPMVSVVPTMPLSPAPANPAGANMPPTAPARAEPSGTKATLDPRSASTPIPGHGAGPSAGSSYLKSLMAKGLPAAPQVLPSPTGDKGAAPPSKGGAHLVTVNDLATDRAAAVTALTSFAQKAGGWARPLEQLAEGKAVVTGLLIAIPEARLDELLSNLAGTGHVQDRQTWTGTPDRRRARLTEDADAQLASLKKLREALLSTYLADSDPVKDTDAEIAHAADYVKELQAPDGSDGMTLIRVNFVAN